MCQMTRRAASVAVRREREGVALTPVILLVLLLRSPNGKQDEGEQNDAENDSRDPGPLRKGSACSP